MARSFDREASERVAKTLRRERARRGLTQREMWEMLGVPRSSYLSWENPNSRAPEPRNRQRIMETLGLLPQDVALDLDGSYVEELQEQIAAMRQQLDELLQRP